MVPDHIHDVLEYEYYMASVIYTPLVTENMKSDLSSTTRALEYA